MKSCWLIIKACFGCSRYTGWGSRILSISITRILRPGDLILIQQYTVEAWYKGCNGTFESVPLYQAVPYIRLWLFCCLFQPNITWYTPIKALLHCKLSMLPPYTIRTKILLCNWQNFDYLDIFYTTNGRGKHEPLGCTGTCTYT